LVTNRSRCAAFYSVKRRTTKHVGSVTKESGKYWIWPSWRGHGNFIFTFAYVLRFSVIKDNAQSSAVKHIWLSRTEFKYSYKTWY